MRRLPGPGWIACRVVILSASSGPAGGTRPCLQTGRTSWSGLRGRAVSNAPSRTTPASDPTGRNRLLASLTAEDRALLRPHLSVVRLERGDVLFQPGEEVGAMHFPCDGTMVSLVVVMPDGRSAETGLIGSEGALGGIVSQGRKPAYARGVVQIPGEACRIAMSEIEVTRERSANFADTLARAADCLLARILQAVACNALHSLEQRMARRLLVVHDRHGAEDLPLTQEYLGEMLGVGRTYVTRTASALQARGIIGYARGRVRVFDRSGLEALACSCEPAIRDHYERVLPGVYPAPPL